MSYATCDIFQWGKWRHRRRRRGAQNAAASAWWSASPTPRPLCVPSARSLSVCHNSSPRRGFVCVCALSLQLRPALRDPMDCSSPGSSVRGILQARRPEWVAVPFSRVSSRPRDGTQVSCAACKLFTAESPGKPSRVYTHT